MIALVEGVNRQKTPNEIALTILLSRLTLIFLVAVISLEAFGIASSLNLTIPVLVALFVCLIPTTMGALLSAIGIAGIDRLVQKNVLVRSGRAVEAAGDVDVLLLDKTGTVTIGNRQATSFLPAPGVTKQQLADAAQLASLADETPEGRSVVILAKQFGIRSRQLSEMQNVAFVPFTARSRMSGVDLDGVSYRKGAADAIRAFVDGKLPESVEKDVRSIAKSGGTPLVVTSQKSVLGTVYLKDIVKGGLRDRFARFRAMGIRTVMITGWVVMKSPGAASTRSVPTATCRSHMISLRPLRMYWGSAFVRSPATMHLANSFGIRRWIWKPMFPPSLRLRIRSYCRRDLLHRVRS
jgi:K+-transporting ATPase ATPase B chain